VRVWRTRRFKSAPKVPTVRLLLLFELMHSVDLLQEYLPVDTTFSSLSQASRLRSAMASRLRITLPWI
jgi:hypothetical protein